MNSPGEYPRRRDRLGEAPCAKNAQGLFLPNACIFVGNLSTKVPLEQLAGDLEALFSRFGPCYVKIKQGKKKDLPGAFVQFEDVKDAEAALLGEESLFLHHRRLRIERARGKRTAVLGLRSGAQITPKDVELALEGRGALEEDRIGLHFAHGYGWTSSCKVTFSYVDDCRDAIKFFSRDDTYWMKMADMEGSASPNRGCSFRNKPHYSTPSFARHGNGNGQGRWFGSRPQGAGFPQTYNRGGYRSFPKNHPQNPQNRPERKSPRGVYQSPQTFNGMPYAAENCPPFYPPYLHPAQVSAGPSLPSSHPPPLPPHNENGYGLPPHFIPSGYAPNGYPGFTGPQMPRPAPAFAPAHHPLSSTTGPYMVNPQMYSPITPPYYGENIHPEHGYFGPQSSMNANAGGYYGQLGPVYYGEPCPPQNPSFLRPPWLANQPTPPPSPPPGNGSADGYPKVPKENQDPNSPQRSPAKSQEHSQSPPRPRVENQERSQPPQSSELEKKPEEEVDLFDLPEPDSPTRLIRINLPGSVSVQNNGKGKGTEQVQPSNPTPVDTGSKTEPPNGNGKETQEVQPSTLVPTNNTDSKPESLKDEIQKVKSSDENPEETQDDKPAKAVPSSTAGSQSEPNNEADNETRKVKSDEEDEETQKAKLSPQRPRLSYPKLSERVPKLSLKTSLKAAHKSSADHSPISPPEDSPVWSPRCSPRASPKGAPKLPTILEEEEMNGYEAETDDETATLASSSGSESDFAPSPAKSMNSEKETRDERSRSPRPTNSLEPRGRSPTRKPLPAQYQPTTGMTVAEYVLQTAAEKESDLNDAVLLDIIRELEEERKASHLPPPYEEVESGSSNRAQCASAGRTSSKSI